jgi:hypothetical protein
MYDLVHSSPFIDFPFLDLRRNITTVTEPQHPLDYHDGSPHLVLICYLTANAFIFLVQMRYGESLTYCTVLQKKKKKKIGLVHATQSDGPQLQVNYCSDLSL